MQLFFGDLERFFAKLFAQGPLVKRKPNFKRLRQGGFNLGDGLIREPLRF